MFATSVILTLCPLSQCQRAWLRLHLYSWWRLVRRAHADPLQRPGGRERVFSASNRLRTVALHQVLGPWRREAGCRGRSVVGSQATPRSVPCRRTQCSVGDWSPDCHQHRRATPCHFGCSLWRIHSNGDSYVLDLAAVHACLTSQRLHRLLAGQETSKRLHSADRLPVRLRNEVGGSN